MKYLTIFGLFFAFQTCLTLPQLVGISNKELINIIDGLKRNYYTSLMYDEIEKQIISAATGCNWADYTTKFNQWTSDAGFSSSANFTSNGQALIDAINSFFSSIDPTNKNSAQIKLDTFCITFRKFFQSLGISQIENCMYASAYVGGGYDRVSAFQTNQVFNVLNYQCGASFKTYSDFITSYISAQTSQQTALATCETQFLNSLNTTAAVADHGCSEMKTYQHCVGKLYNQAASSLELGWTVCEAVRRSNIVTLPACRDSTWFCDLSQLSI
jgi:hypothetical protein